MGSPGLHLRRTPRLCAAVAAAVGVGGCGGGSSGGLKISDATLADTTITAGVPDAFDAKARQAPNTFVGKIGRSGWAYVAIVVHGDHAVVYLCDGQVGEWFGTAIRGGRIGVRDRVGTVVDAVVHRDTVTGTVRPPGQPTGGFTAARPSAAGIGLFKGPDLSGSGHIRRWIVLADGIRGVSDPPAADVVAGAGSATRQAAPASTTATATTASPAASDVVAGSGAATRSAASTTATTTSPATSDVVAGSGAATRPTSSTTSRSVATTTLTHSVSTTTTTSTTTTSTTTTAPTSTTTATSRTTTPPASISDGTSNTIIIGETTATSSLSSSSSGDGSVRTLGGTTTTTSSTTPGLTLVTSSSSTTVTLAAIVDGTSNTITFGEATINGVAAGSTPPPTPPAPAVTNCVSTQPCPPPTPRLTSKVPTVTFGQSASGTPNIVAGGSLLDCATLAKLVAGLAVPAATGNSVASGQLTLLLAQAKANGC